MYFAESSPVKIDITELLQNLISLYFDHDYDSIYKLLKIEESNNHRKNIPSSKYYDEGMRFIEDDNPQIQVRIHVDDEIKYPLNTLLMISSNSIDEKYFLSTIVDKWIDSTKTYGLMNKNKIPKIIGKESYIQLKIGSRTWDDLTKSCRNKGILMKNGFKMAVTQYLDEICLNNTR